MDFQEKYENFAFELQKQQEREDDGLFVINNIDKANWCIGKIMKAKSKQTELSEFVKREKERLDRFLEEEYDELEREIERRSNMLLPFAATQIDGKKKSIKLPNGTMGFRNTTKVEKDEKLLFEWAKESAVEFIKTAESLDWATLKKSCIVDDGRYIYNGEILEGVSEEKTIVFYVK